MKKLLLFLSIGLFSCTEGIEMTEVPSDYLLNDGNSKVWMIEQMIVDNTDISARLNEEKELIIFYQSGRFQYIPIKQLGHITGKTGTYELSNSNKELRMYFPDKKWYFKLKEFSEDSIYLTPLKASEANFSIQLVPLKEIMF